MKIVIEPDELITWVSTSYLLDMSHCDESLHP